VVFTSKLPATVLLRKRHIQLSHFAPLPWDEGSALLWEMTLVVGTAHCRTSRCPPAAKIYP